MLEWMLESIQSTRKLQAWPAIISDEIVHAMEPRLRTHWHASACTACPQVSERDEAQRVPRDELRYSQRQ